MKISDITIESINAANLKLIYKQSGFFSRQEKTHIVQCKFLAERLEYFKILSQGINNINYLFEDHDKSMNSHTSAQYNFAVGNCKVINPFNRYGHSELSRIQSYNKKLEVNEFLQRIDYSSPEFDFDFAINTLTHDRLKFSPKLDPSFEYNSFTFQEMIGKGNSWPQAKRRIRLLPSSNQDNVFDISEVRLLLGEYFHICLRMIQSLTTIVLQSAQTSTYTFEAKKKLVNNIHDDLERLIFRSRGSYFKKEPAAHKFVDSKTLSRDNPNIGFLGERALFNYLHNKFSGPKWKDALRTLGGNYNDYYLRDFSDLNISWMNGNGESYRPYDFILKVDSPSIQYYIDAKTTRSQVDTDILVSIAELDQMLSNPQSYLIARIYYLHNGSHHGIQIHDEFGVKFYRFTGETIATVKSNIEEWRGHYREKVVHFKSEHFSEL